MNDTANSNTKSDQPILTPIPTFKDVKTILLKVKVFQLYTNGLVNN